MNPFKYGSIVMGEDFCGRKKLIQQIQDHIISSQNIVLYGERRVGKTSLIYEAARQNKGYRTLQLDLMNVKSIDALCRKFLAAIGAMEQQSGFFERFLKSIPSLRPSLSIDPITGLPSISIDSSISLTESSLQEIVGLIKKAHKGKPLVVVIDEFQAILDIQDSDAVIAELRGQVQHAPEVPFIFAGSIRHQMEEIFTSPSSPFFKSAIPLEVGPLSFAEFAPFLLKRFKSGERTIGNDSLKILFDLAGGITGDVQQFCEAVWSKSDAGDTITQEHLIDAIDLLISRELLSFQIILARLTELQMRVLITLAKVGGEKPTSKEFLEEAESRNASAITQTLNRLAQMKIIYRAQTEWKYMNPVLRLFLLRVA
jgi:hypothetical protein